MPQPEIRDPHDLLGGAISRGAFVMPARCSKLEPLVPLMFATSGLTLGGLIACVSLRTSRPNGETAKRRNGVLTGSSDLKLEKDPLDGFKDSKGNRSCGSPLP